MTRKDLARKETGTSVERHDWLHPFYAFRQDMDRLMENFFRGFDLRPFGERMEGFVPHIDVVDTDKEIKVSAELPGMDEKDVEVSLTAGTLAIRGEKKEEHEEKGKDYFRSERSFGSFSRSVTLPVEVDADKVEASFRKGVLTVTLPKTRQAVDEARMITVKAG
jgi:HSP20 family protein